MITLTPNKLKNLIQNYDYEITLEQAKNVLELLDEYYGEYTIEDIETATDYIVNGDKSVFTKIFS